MHVSLAITTAVEINASGDCCHTNTYIDATKSADNNWNFTRPCSNASSQQTFGHYSALSKACACSFVTRIAYVVLCNQRFVLCAVVRTPKLFVLTKHAMSPHNVVFNACCKAFSRVVFSSET